MNYNIGGFNANAAGDVNSLNEKISRLEMENQLLRNERANFSNNSECIVRNEFNKLNERIAMLELENQRLKSEQNSRNRSHLNPVSIIIPGRNPEVILNEGNGILSTEIQNPQSVSNFIVATNDQLFNSESGGMFTLNESFFPYQTWEFLGVLTNIRKSDIFTTGWPFIDGINSIPSVKIFITVEPANVLLEKLETKPPIDYNKEVAKKIALNLFRFIESYNNSNSLNIPQCILDKWISRFDEKYKLDPYFFMKTN
ncbi:putative DUF775 domain protein [Cryptosporidium felis]|nr:putative DUF775 domain protein [Cryptosporidium felis]